jgi:hypothetical protein
VTVEGGFYSNILTGEVMGQRLFRTGAFGVARRRSQARLGE